MDVIKEDKQKVGMKVEDAWDRMSRSKIIHCGDP